MSTVTYSTSDSKSNLVYRLMRNRKSTLWMIVQKCQQHARYNPDDSNITFRLIRTYESNTKSQMADVIADAYKNNPESEMAKNISPYFWGKN